MTHPKTPAPSSSLLPTVLIQDGEAAPPVRTSPKMGPKSMPGKIRTLVERHPDGTVDVLRRWMSETGGE